MESSSKHSYQRGFQRTGEEIVSGPWSMAPKLDPVSEKKYLFFTLRSNVCAALAQTVFSFRGRAAEEISPKTCLPILDVKKEKARVELLTPFAKPVTPATLEASDVEGLLHMLFRTLAAFESHDFAAMNLALDAVGIDENGSFVLLPNAYILPFPLPEKDAVEDLIAAARIDGHTPSHSSVHERHMRGLLSSIESIRASATGRANDRSAFEDCDRKLAALADAIQENPAATLPHLYRLAFEEPLDAAAFRHPPGAAEPVSRIVRQADAIATIAGTGGGIVLVTGGALSGKSMLLREAARILKQTGAWNVSIPDEWDLFTKSRRKNGQRNAAGLPSAYLIDNIDERAFVYSDLATEALKGDLLRHNLFVMTTDPAHTSAEAREFIKTLRARAGERYREIELMGNPAGTDPRSDLLAGILLYLSPDCRASASTSPITLASDILCSLRDEEKQLLEFIAIARFAVPVDITLSLFQDRGNALCKAVQRLAALGLVDLKYRYGAEQDAIRMLLSMRHSSIGRLVYMSIPRERRKNLSKTIPLLAEDHGSFPPYHFLYHLLKGEERAQAAKFCVNYFKTNKGDSRPFFFTLFAKNLVENGLFEILPFHSQIFILKELSEDLLKTGDAARAKELLLTAVAILDKTETEKQTQHAQLITSTCLMLADIRESRGQYTKALDLLTDIKETLQAYLSIPDQARLSNDIGWLQYRLGDYERSAESCTLSLTSVNSSEYPLVVAQALNTMGVVHFNTSRYDEAISYYERSASLREQACDYSALAASYNNLGLVHQTKGEYETALDYYNRSLEIKERQKNKAGIAAGYLNLALLYLEMNNFTEAEEKCNASLAISKAVGNAQLTAENFSSLGDIALKREQFDQAEEYYLQSLKICQKIETINEEMGALRRLSQLHLRQKRYEEAQKTIAQASEIGLRIGSKLETAQIGLILGDLKVVQKQHMEAIEHYQKAASSFTTLSKYRMAAIALAKTGLIHAVNGNTLEARQFLDRGLDIIRSDIGHEYPGELVALQNTLREHPLKTGMPDEAAEKLLIAFYELSTLSDYALDRHELFKKLLEIVRLIIDPEDCFLAFKTDENEFELYDCNGEQSTSASKAQSALFTRTLLLGCLLEGSSPDVFDILSDLHVPGGAGFISIPLKAMGEDLGCLYLYLGAQRLPLSKENTAFMTSLGRHFAGNLRLMVHFEEHLETSAKPEKESEDTRTAVKEAHRFEHLISESKQMKDILSMLEKIKTKTPNILFIGESGTGKTEMARAVHFNSPRGCKPFQPIHCAQIPDTLIESELFGHERGSFTGAYKRKIGLCEIADGGTIFLDDVNAVPPEIQKKLLSFIETKSFMRIGGDKTLHSDVRIIAASNEDLERLCKEGKFREDLYFRLKVICVLIPPLRERKEDIAAIAQAFLKKRCKELGIPLKTLAPETMRLFQRSPWRGNVRELQNVLERVLLLTDDTVIYPASLPEDVLREVSGIDKHRTKNALALAKEIIALENYSESNPLMPQMEALFARLMVEHAKAKGKAAALLGITKPTLYSRLDKYDDGEA